MKQRKVVSMKNLSMRMPLIPSLVFWLMLERLDAAGWVWGIVGTLMGLIWIAWIVDVINMEQVEVIK